MSWLMPQRQWYTCSCTDNSHCNTTEASLLLLVSIFPFRVKIFGMNCRIGPAASSIGQHTTAPPYNYYRSRHPRQHKKIELLVFTAGYPYNGILATLPTSPPLLGGRNIRKCGIKIWKTSTICCTLNQHLPLRLTCFIRTLGRQQRGVFPRIFITVQYSTVWNHLLLPKWHKHWWFKCTACGIDC